VGSEGDERVFGRESGRDRVGERGGNQSRGIQGLGLIGK
jgi:hypothetical protein